MAHQGTKPELRRREYIPLDLVTPSFLNDTASKTIVVKVRGIDSLTECGTACRDSVSLIDCNIMQNIGTQSICR